MTQGIAMRRMARFGLAVAMLLVGIAPVPAGFAVPTLGYYGTAAWPSGTKVLAGPRGIAVAPDGTLFVADTENHRVKHISADGAVLASWGSRGSAPGQLSEPQGLAVSPSGVVYVADTGNDRIQAFLPNGTFLSTWGETGTGLGQLSRPTAVACDEAGDVYVADAYNGRIQVFDAAGTPLRVLGSPGAGEGELAGPVGLAVSGGYVYVAETTNRRVQKLTTQGAFVLLWGPEIGNGQTVESTSRYAQPGGVSVGADGNIYVVDRGRGVIERCGPDGALLATFASPGHGPGSLSYPVGIAAGDTVLYVADTGNSRVGRFSAADGAWLGEWSGRGSGPGELDAPMGVVAAPGGGVLVSDTGNHRLQWLSSTGSFESEFATDLVSPGGAAMGADGTLWVADPAASVVRGFDGGGSQVATVGGASAPGLLTTPTAVAAGPDGHLYVADAARDAVVKVSTAGAPLGLFSGLSAPYGVAVAASGTVYASDVDQHRITAFSPAGAVVGTWGTYGVVPGQFRRPLGITVGPEGDVWVCDEGNDRVQRFTATGAFVAEFGAQGTGLGELDAPSAVALGPAGEIYIAERGNHRVQVFGYDDVAPVTTPLGVSTGWTNVPAAVTLSPADDRSGVDRTYVRVGSAEATEYAAPFVIDTQGETPITYWSVDRAGNMETTQTLFVRLDSIAPTGSMIVEGGRAYAATRTLSVESTVSDIGPSSLVRLRTRVGTAPWSSTVDWAPTVHATAHSDGTLTVTARFSDWLGNTTDLSDTIIVDTTPPLTVASPVPAVTTGTVPVALQASDALAGVTSTWYRVGAAAPQSYSGTFTVSAEGSTMISFGSVDALGNAEPTRTVTVVIDRTPPSGSFSLNGGATYATSNEVALDFDVPDAVEMRFDSGSGFGPWQAYGAAAPVMLDGEGARLVVGQFRDAAGNVAEMTDSIVIDVNAPSLYNDAKPTYVGTAKIGIGASDDGSGVDYIAWSVDGSAWTTTSSMAATVAVEGIGSHELIYYAVDRMGSATDPLLVTFEILESDPPFGPIMNQPSFAPVRIRGTGSWLYDSRITLRAADPQGVAGYSWWWNGVADLTTDTATGIVNDYGRAPGTNVLSARSVDGDGVWGAPVELTVSRGQASGVPVVAVPATGSTTKATRLAGSAGPLGARPVVIVRCYRFTAAGTWTFARGYRASVTSTDSGWRWSASPKLPAGTFRVTAEVRDAAGTSVAESAPSSPIVVR